MASIDRRPNGHYRARWREYPGGPQKTKSFALKKDAERFLDGIRGDLARGIYVDPALGQETFRHYAEDWRKVQPHRGSTTTNVEQDLRLHIYPTLGNRPLASIRPSHVQALVTALTPKLAPSTLQRVYGRVTAVFAAAVRDRVIGFSPCIDVRLPQGRSAAVEEVLTTEQVLALVDNVPARYRGLIVTAAGTGLRPGELFGLDGGRVEFLRRTLKVDQQLVRMRGEGVMLGPLKTEKSYRTLPLPGVVGDALAAHLKDWPAQTREMRFCDPADPDKVVTVALAFTNERGAPIQQHPFAEMFENARRRAGLPEWATPHDLRHYFASLLIRSGASVKLVQARLGHASAKTTLDTYAKLWPDDEERTREAVDAELARRAEDHLRTEGASG